MHFPLKSRFSIVTLEDYHIEKVTRAKAAKEKAEAEATAAAEAEREAEEEAARE